MVAEWEFSQDADGKNKVFSEAPRAGPDCRIPEVQSDSTEEIYLNFYVVISSSVQITSALTAAWRSRFLAAFISCDLGGSCCARVSSRGKTPRPKNPWVASLLALVAWRSTMRSRYPAMELRLLVGGYTNE